MMVESDESILIATDFHLGIEYELAKLGVNIPYQTNRIRDELISLIREYKPNRLLLLGDIKHGVPITSFYEKQEIPLFFQKLQYEVEHIDVTRGNHDGNIQDLVPEGVKIHSSRGILIGENPRIAALHGHAWPHLNILDADLVVMGHNHPTVLLSTPLGIRISKRAWVKGTLKTKKLAEMIMEQKGENIDENILEDYKAGYSVDNGNIEMVIMPTFNDLLGGLPVNAESPKSLLGPLFRTGVVDVRDFDVFLLDSTYLGKVNFLKELLENPQNI
jgi:metallophosphoesterase superfamily enzyme